MHRYFADFFATAAGRIPDYSDYIPTGYAALVFQAMCWGSEKIDPISERFNADVSWFTSVPPLLSPRSWYYIVGGTPKLRRRIDADLPPLIEPVKDGIAVRLKNREIRDLVRHPRTDKRGFPVPLPSDTPARPYAMIHDIAAFEGVSLQAVLLTALPPIREMAGAPLPPGEAKDELSDTFREVYPEVLATAAMCPVKQFVRPEFALFEMVAKVYGLTIDEAMMTFSVESEEDVHNLLLAARLFGLKFDVDVQRDGTYLIQYPEYKYENFLGERYKPREPDPEEMMRAKIPRDRRTSGGSRSSWPGGQI